mmetsp:Transcript_109708/g.318950  ORF Transcript_109708/g.318950 Transcript_109708/m.318950 type:complete len:924 (-) Transcript_109708:290-3061(-)
MSIMLEISMVISGAAEEWADFTIITVMLLVNSLLGFFEDMKAKASVNALKAKMVNHVDTVRYGEDGRKTYVPLNPKFLVVGDTIHVRGGDAIPADCSFLEGSEISINTAAMTGESLPVKFNERGPMEIDPSDPTHTKKIHKLVLAGCVVHQSPGTHLRVEKVGANTESGKATLLIAGDSQKQVSAFEEKILNVVMYLIIFTLIDVICVICVQCEIRGKDFWSEIVDCLSLIIASVPVALPMVIQITMALGAANMAEQKAIVTSFPALQDIAAMTVLCSDKTGTLTTADITVEFNDIRTWNGFTKEQVMDAAAVACGESTEDPIDRAVRMSYAKSIKNPAATLSKWKVFKVAGFTPEVKRFVAYAEHPVEGRKKLAKGLLDKILDTGDDGGDLWVCEDLAKIEADVRSVDIEFSKKGYKTVGVAIGEEVNGKWVMKFAGIIPMIDPPRHDTADVIQKLNANGIQVRMITGDHKNIAIETAKRIGLPPNILANTELEYLEQETVSESEDGGEEKVTESTCFNMCDIEAAEAHGENLALSSKATKLILDSGGFAQVMPTDKLVIVKTFRNANGGSITGMTGDGVNDAPALKAANVGIAVKGSTAAAQQAADIILTDDGLMPIHTAVVESRKIYARLKSYVLYRIGATIQIVIVLSTLIFAYDKTIPALYVILLALLNDVTMLTVSYDNARVSPQPVRPTVFGIVATAAVVGSVMAISSIGFYMLGHYGAILDTTFRSNTDAGQAYVAAVMYVQISIGIEMMIFNCREPDDWFWSSAPCASLFWSVVFANLLVIILAATGTIVDTVSWGDIGLIVGYDCAVFLFTDVVKVMTAKLLKEGGWESAMEGERANYAKPGGSPSTNISDSEWNQPELCMSAQGIWSVFGKEVQGWAEERTPASALRCCRPQGRDPSLPHEDQITFPGSGPI